MTVIPECAVCSRLDFYFFYYSSDNPLINVRMIQIGARHLSGLIRHLSGKQIPLKCKTLQVKNPLKCRAPIQMFDIPDPHTMFCI